MLNECLRNALKRLYPKNYSYEETGYVCCISSFQVSKTVNFLDTYISKKVKLFNLQIMIASLIPAKRQVCMNPEDFGKKKYQLILVKRMFTKCFEKTLSK